ncbi:hypothetical protein FGSG_13642 [Fusarium graminearum PH-1]|uniref:Chromosome 4, complete genome n=1 Tax=Gibberella zeae (strain ATCC MYA-4620 / CBS 123657 / FGSC 9075 / NRRL 31084 / PH-1) TaxID=229533 RepID=I1S9W1_GIBZE|nr:hypothetical protein FGSG_13642 [Fusarium graminearum PH-1]ESU16399.1 hypothetical protein FGSG_13642 [Fusarium graminearum PH-1]CEF83340.1 unnamed protein product [Fusarium graminearum]|eukprot:XP_011327917.1 hypothetical protein FGSG_13642 [Fusarium graminearum PH-1]
MDTKYSEIDLVSLITAQTSRRSYRDYISYGILTLSADKDMMLARESGPMQPQARIISHQLGSTLQSTSLASRTTLLMTSSFRLYPSPLSVVHSNPLFGRLLSCLAQRAKAVHHDILFPISCRQGLASRCNLAADHVTSLVMYRYDMSKTPSAPPPYCSHHPCDLVFNAPQVPSGKDILESASQFSVPFHKKRTAS